MSELNAAQRKAVAELLRVSPVADELGRRFAVAGHELHLVGGSVRDALLGRLGDDLDFCTDAHPDQTLAIVRGWADAIWETGREFGTIGVQRTACGSRSRRSGPRRTTGSPATRSSNTAPTCSTTCDGVTSRSTRWPSRCPVTPSPTRTAGWPIWPAA
jgi:hypothetical protein